MSLPRDRATVSEAEWELAIRRSRVMDELLVRGSAASVSDAAREQGLSIALMYRLLARYRRNPSPGALVRFIEDLVWALMQPLSGTPYRILHAMQRKPFRVLNGFNTPVQVANWLSFAPLAVHRPLLAVFAGLLQPESPLWPADFGSFGRGRFLLI